MRILLIDDNKDICQLTKTILSEQGYQVAFYGNAEDGIKSAKSNKPNLILMDVLMPGLGGAEAVRELKKDQDLKDIPVVFLTALVTNKEQTFKNINVDGEHYRTLGKPYEIDQLLQVVREVIK
jgi:CheY-like chemotaxis protein